MRGYNNFISSMPEQDFETCTLVCSAADSLVGGRLFILGGSLFLVNTVHITCMSLRAKLYSFPTVEVRLRDEIHPSLHPLIFLCCFLREYLQTDPSCPSNGWQFSCLCHKGMKLYHNQIMRGELTSHMICPPVLKPWHQCWSLCHYIFSFRLELEACIAKRKIPGG